MQAAGKIVCSATLMNYCRRFAKKNHFLLLHLPVTCNILKTSHRLQSVSTDVIPPPPEHNMPKQYPPKIEKLVSDISELTLLEVADLNELLKKTLNIQDAPMMAMGAMAVAAPKEEEEDVAPQREKSIFTVKLTKFDAGKKVQLIKEIKKLVEGLNLVQAKKFVESVPQVVKADIPKDEAEQLKESLAAVGAEVEIE